MTLWPKGYTLQLPPLTLSRKHGLLFPFHPWRWMQMGRGPSILNNILLPAPKHRALLLASFAFTSQSVYDESFGKKAVGSPPPPPPDPASYCLKRDCLLSDFDISPLTSLWYTYTTTLLPYPKGRKKAASIGFSSRIQ